MKKTSPEIQELIEAVKYRPAVSLIMPFEPKMDAKSELVHSLKIAAGKIERELSGNYPKEIANIVMIKLNRCIKNLNFSTHKKSIAIYVSPIVEKIMYLEIPVKEKIVVNESFEIRDLVYCKKDLQKYLLLLLSSQAYKIFLGDTNSLINIVSSGTDSAFTDSHDLPERVANFSDTTERKEIILNKFLYLVDNTLNIILKAYPLPLFVLGAKKIAGHFKAITKNTSAVIEYVHGNYEEASVVELQQLLQPYLANWKKIKQKTLLNLLEDANGKKKLALGIQDVWKQASKKNGRLLVVEKNYNYAAVYGSSKEDIYPEAETTFSTIKDAVDDVIEKVLENGGDVEFTEAGTLKHYDRIALIQYY